MTAAGFLDDAALAQLTGWKLKSRQIGWLKAEGIPFRVNATGHAVVTWAAVEGRGEEPAPQPVAVDEPLPEFLWQRATPLDWGGMMLRPDLPVFSREQPRAATQEAGLYGLCLREGGVRYIGKAKCLSARIQQHRRASAARREPWFDGFLFRPVPEFALSSVEVAHIRALEPEVNGLYEPVHWPGHAAMVAALRNVWGIEP